MSAGGDTGRALAGGALALAAILVFAACGVAPLIGSGFQGSQPLLISDPYILRILRFTLLQAALSTLLSLGLAIPFARALARQPRFPGRVWVIRLMGLPLGLPVIVGALGLISVWGRNGWANGLLQHLGLAQPVSIYGLSGILLAHVFFNFPLASRLFLTVLERLPPEYWLVASNLGMRPLSLFRFIEWPQIRRQIPGVAGLVFMLAATSFTLVLLLGGGPAATTLEVAIYQALRFDFDPARAVSLALMQISVTALLLITLAFLRVDDPLGTSAGMRAQRPGGLSLLPRLIDALLLLSGSLFVLLPLAAVLLGGLRADMAKLLGDAIVWRALATSLALALPSGLLAVLLAWLILEARLAISGLRTPGPVLWAYGRSLPALASLILLLPPTVLGTGWFLLIGPARLEPLAPLVVVAINGLMALPFVLRVLDPVLSTHRARTGRLAASLGIAGFNRLRRIDMPALGKPLLMALSFGMALSLGDLGAVALFGSDSLITLPWLLYSRMGSYRTADAAGLALLLALLCLALSVAGTAGQMPGKGVRNDR
nr:thiamine/thiamine pyrophosphate ABC transporter permease [uncultured Gellertiella sp.]